MPFYTQRRFLLKFDCLRNESLSDESVSLRTQGEPPSQLLYDTIITDVVNQHGYALISCDCAHYASSRAHTQICTSVAPVAVNGLIIFFNSADTMQYFNVMYAVEQGVHYFLETFYFIFSA